MLSLTTTSTRPWFSSLMAWAKPSTASTRAPLSRTSWAQLLVATFGGDLALEVGERRDGVVVGPGDDDALTDGVRVGQVVLGLALVVDGDLVGDDVEAVGLHGREDRIPRRFDEFDLHPQLVANGLGDVDVVADQLPALIVVAERRVYALRADPHHAGGLESVRLVRVGRRAGRGGEHRRQQDHREQRSTKVMGHRRNLASTWDHPRTVRLTSARYVTGWRYRQVVRSWVVIDSGLSPRNSSRMAWPSGESARVSRGGPMCCCHDDSRAARRCWFLANHRGTGCQATAPGSDSPTTARAAKSARASVRSAEEDLASDEVARFGQRRQQLVESRRRTAAPVRWARRRVRTGSSRRRRG